MSNNCELKDKLAKRKDVLKTLKQMLCKLENNIYSRDKHVQPTSLTRGERCDCHSNKPPPGEAYSTQDLAGEEGFPKILPPVDIRVWVPEPICPNQDYYQSMGCYKAAKVCKLDCEMCCECEVAEGAHVHLPEKRDQSKPLQDQCYPVDKCTAGSVEKLSPSCDPDIFPGRYRPKLDITCCFPKTCKASCYEHADYRDWTPVRPTYTYYKQLRGFKSF